MYGNVPWVSQERLVERLREIFIDVYTHVNTKKHVNIKYPATNSYLELDVWIPDKELCFEFQDAYHYTTTWYAQATREKIKQKDHIKRSLSQQRGISLVVVPCWWDGTVESLVSTIHFYRPDLLEANYFPSISLNPPKGFFQPRLFPHIGELMLASFPTEKFDIKSSEEKMWWMGEKYDGIRCVYDPQDRTVFSRGGNELYLTKRVKTRIPKFFIDGEFWFGRGNYGYTYVLFKGSTDLVCWDLLRLVAFDTPTLSIQRNPFEVRYAHLLRSISSKHPFTLLVSRVSCVHNGHMHTWVQGIINEGGEGVILRKIHSLYEHGRSKNLVKLKTVYGDMEGVVVAIAPDNSVQLKIPSGTLFTVPPESVQVKKLAVGDVVTFSYESNARRDVPVGPRIFRIRTDLSWREVLENAAAEKKYLNENVPVAPGFTSKPQGHWTSKSMRNFFENFAKTKNLDPLVAETWTKIQQQDLQDTKEGNSVLQKLKGYRKAVASLFPELPIDEKNKLNLPRGGIEARRNYFEKYARVNNFNPQIADNWYSQPEELIMSHKGAAGILYYYRTLAKALIDSFPNIGLDETRLWDKTLWHSKEARRKFFVNFANVHKFDPLVPENWYSQNKNQILSTKGALKVLFYHSHSISTALMDLFPKIGLEKEKFWATTFSWRNVQNRKLFFENFAKSQGFDPNVAENWYSQNQDTILSLKGAASIISYHQKNLPQALVDLFPNIGLDKEKFHSNNKWAKESERRLFFENYAKEKGFDPLNPEAWYTQSKNKMMATQGISSVIVHHKGSVGQALSDLFPLIPFDKSLLFSRFLWRDKERRRKFFENYARVNDFDPLIADNWYSQPTRNIMAMENAGSVVNYHKDSVPQALVDLFPNIGLSRAKFPSQPVWNEFENRKNFFLQYARSHGFDPHNPNNWYEQRRHRIFAAKGAFSIVNYHNGKASTALLEIFPDIGLEPSRIPF